MERQRSIVDESVNVKNKVQSVNVCLFLIVLGS
jgi:hypothetical protein